MRLDHLPESLLEIIGIVARFRFLRGFEEAFVFLGIVNRPGLARENDSRIPAFHWPI